MQKLLLTVLAVVLAANAAAAQLSSTKARGSANSAVSGNAGDKLRLDSASTIDAELLSTIDAKNAKVGDAVILKTVRAVKQNGETVIPKGAKLLGRVTEVSKKGKSSAGSRVGMIFDRIESKGLTAPITASIVSITNASAAVGFDDTAADLGLASSTSGRTSTRSSGGGLLGGVGNTVGGVVNTATQTTGAVVGGATETVGSTAGTLGRTVNGLQITQSTGGSANGAAVISSGDKNVRLEKGVNFSLLVGGSDTN
jgi:hypothetical protein